MQVCCPNCRDDLDIADERLASGVAKVRCTHCSFAFTIRLGDPNAKPPEEEEKDLTEPKQLEGVTASGDVTSASGEIGNTRHRFIGSETQTLVRVDTSFVQQAEEAGQEIVRDDEEGKAAEPEAAPPEPEAEPEAEPEEDPAAKATLLDYPVPDLQPAKQELRPALADDPTQQEILPPVEEQADREEALAKEPTEVEAEPLTPEPALEPDPALASVDTEEEEPEPEAIATPTPTPKPEPELEDVPELEPDPEPDEPEVEAAPPPLPGEPTAPPLAKIPTPGLSAPYAILEYDEDSLSSDDLNPRRPGQGKGMRALGLMMTVVVGITAAVFFFILIRNDWSLDMAHFDTMINRAFNLQSADKVQSDELRGLEATVPVLDKGQLSNGDPVILAQGKVKNNDTRARRFIYVKVTVSRHGRLVVTGKAPAANVFIKANLAKMTKAEMQGRITAGGQDGSNTKVDAGKSVNYMVVLTRVPLDFSPAKYTATAEITEAEVPQD